MGDVMKTKKIIFSGGGTAGPVSPLLAIFDELSDPPLSPLKTRGGAKYKFLWIGTKSGVEKGMVEKENIKFKAITSGKLRRYFSWENFIDPFKILIGFFQSIFIILKFKPDLVMSAGGFVSVPVIWAAWCLRVPVLIHQQDIRPGFANKLMAPFAKIITVTFEKSLEDYGEKAEWVGNPIRESIKNYKLKITNKFNFNNNLPVVLVVGGGTGAGFLNDITIKSAKELSEVCNIVLLAGKGKITNYKLQITNLQIYEFLNVDEMAEALQMSDVVVSRSGLGLSTELSALAKPTIFIPIPDSHQEDNAQFFQEKESAIVLNQKTLTPKEFFNVLSILLIDPKAQEKLSQNISRAMKIGASEKIAEIVNYI
jgi:UDP-N-acetylglucosamine--N-acetylmuramyl-(pentapeptide) pyrophosphoryl-undecaprenol N-acetylglucosamine transferase